MRSAPGSDPGTSRIGLPALSVAGRTPPGARPITARLFMTQDRALAELQAECPAMRIWREQVGDRIQFVARGLTLDVHPHTVVTSDLAELRAALAPARQAALPGAAEPNIARMYSYMLRGKDHYQADRHALEAVLGSFPELAPIAQANRAFVARAVRHVARQGVTQFIDAGAGLPASPNIHETARNTAPGARVVYVDRDPVVVSHGRALLACDDRVAVVAGDIRDPAAVLADPALTAVIDLEQPVCVLLTAVLHFIEPAEADRAVAAFRQLMTPGSYLIISAGTSTGTDPELIRSLQAAYSRAALVAARTETEIADWFAGMCLARPGLSEVWAWRTPPRQAQPPSRRARFLAGVARKSEPNFTRQA